jgi:plasmid maintenance system antidote protein VapI
MIRVSHKAGVSIRQLAEASGLARKTVTAIVSQESELQN